MQMMTPQEFGLLKEKLEKRQCSITQDQRFVEKGEQTDFLIEYKNETLRIQKDRAENPILIYAEPHAFDRFVAHIDKHMD